MAEVCLDNAHRENIVALARRYPEIKLVYLFGSRARGEAVSSSDYDFGVYVSADDKRQEIDVYLSFIGHLPKAVKSEEIDVVPLHAADRPELCYRIITEGALLYEVPPYRLIAEPMILNEYFDFKLSQSTHFAV